MQQRQAFNAKRHDKYGLWQECRMTAINKKGVIRQKMGIHIRKTVEDDLPSIMNIYETAKKFMKNNGNPSQWNSSYPEESLIRRDIEKGNSYVFVDGENIVGTFAFIIGTESNYRIIKNGAWNYNAQYGTIHRIASDGHTKGLAKACFDFCVKKCSYLRIDTHMDNKPMQAAIRKYGFQECGIINVEDGTERIAFDYMS